MTTSNSGEKPALNGAGGAHAAALSPFDDFMADIVDLSLSIDGELAGILLGGAPAPEKPRLPWERDRWKGLELCLSMLRYAREEAPDGELARRVDEAIEHAVAELGRKGVPRRPN